MLTEWGEGRPLGNDAASARAGVSLALQDQIVLGVWQGPHVLASLEPRALLACLCLLFHVADWVATKERRALLARPHISLPVTDLASDRIPELGYGEPSPPASPLSPLSAQSPTLPSL